MNIPRVSVIVILVWSLAGCASQSGPSEPTTPLPTFTETIAPIIYENCSVCHRPGAAGPFPLLSYEDVRAKAQTIVEVTKSRFMPPWPADPSYAHFLGERVLSTSDIEAIAAWVAAGAPMGDPAKTPPQPSFAESSGLGEADLIVRMQEPIRIPGDNLDHFMVIKLPYEIPRDRFVRAIEFVPGNTRLMHHMNGHIVQYEGQKKDPFVKPYSVDRLAARTLEESYDVIRVLNDDGSYPALTRSVANYLPGGISPSGYAAGIGGWTMNRRGAFLMRDVHYGPTSVEAEDQSYFKIYFMDKAPERPTLEMQMGTLGISEIVPPLVIPPNVEKTFTTKYVVDQDISLLTVVPHMHLLGKSFEAFAETPDGRRIPLVRIPRWDFRWQYFYTLPRLLKVPRGSTITAIGLYDNTAANPNNPNSPPKEVIGTNGSMRVTDEMFQLIMTYVPYKDGDEHIALGGESRAESKNGAASR